MRPDSAVAFASEKLGERQAVFSAAAEEQRGWPVRHGVGEP